MNRSVCATRHIAFPLTLLILSVMLVGCGSLPSTSIRRAAPYGERPPTSAIAQEKSNSIVLFALGLIDTGYRFGGKNPAAGFDCSGMVSYIFEQAIGIRVTGSAADIAQRGKPVDMGQLRPGDLVFFNTSNKPFSHVGIYIGDDRFVHAPSSSGLARVRTESLKTTYFATRLEAARSLLD
jgi:cell wall-associated NlpC family hydrolase